MVITGRTRNAFALRGTRVRIPPTPLKESELGFRFLFSMQDLDASSYINVLNDYIIKSYYFHSEFIFCIPPEKPRSSLTGMSMRRQNNAVGMVIRPTYLVFRLH